VDIDSLELAYDSRWFFGTGHWGHIGEPQEEQMISHLREVHRLKQSGAKIKSGGVDRFTWENSAKAIIKELS
jgi:hypothetical protein